jgi:hypothetical protein
MELKNKNRESETHAEQMILEKKYSILWMGNITLIFIFWERALLRVLLPGIT